MSAEKRGINRRSFLSVMAAGALSAAGSAAAQENAENKAAESADAPLRTTYPVLQNPGGRRITVVWGVMPENGLKASGWVEWGRTRDLGQTTRQATFGLNQLSDTFLSARLTGLEPGTEYFYRTATCPIAFKGAYDIKSGEPVYSEIYRFKTPSRSGDTASFAVINDTHENQATLRALMERIAELNPDLVVWNGDLLNAYNEPKQVVDSVFCPQYGAFAAERPLVFNHGNHDHRGIWAREKSSALTPWLHKSEFSDLGRNYVLRIGPLALIGLDTGEDKPDANPVFAGLAQFEPYRERQAAWLAHVLQTKAVQTAPFVVAVCHIPIFDSNPNANPGDIMEGFAAWQRPAAKMWGPQLSKAGVQLVIAAHEHRFRYDPASGERSWSQVVGGGPELEKNTTILRGSVAGGKMTLVVEKMADRSVLGQWEFAPRS